MFLVRTMEDSLHEYENIEGENGRCYPSSSYLRISIFYEKAASNTTGLARYGLWDQKHEQVAAIVTLTSKPYSLLLEATALLEAADLRQPSDYWYLVRNGKSLQEQFPNARDPGCVLRCRRERRRV